MDTCRPVSASNPHYETAWGREVEGEAMLANRGKDKKDQNAEYPVR